MLVSVSSLTFSAFAKSPRIINGGVVQPQTEWQKKLLLGAVRIGSVQLDESGKLIQDSFKSYCSGTLVEGHRIASANHCFANPFVKPNLYAEVRLSIDPDVRKLVRLNRVSTAAESNELMNIMNASDGTKRELDLALVDFEDEDPKIDKSHEIMICREGLSINSKFVAAGFGLTENPSDDLKHLRMTPLPIEEIKPGTIWSHPFEKVDDASTCFGDSGGGLYVIRDNKKDLCISGVVSGNDSGNRGEKPPNSISNTPKPPGQTERPPLQPIVIQPIKPPSPEKRCMKPGQRQIFARVKVSSHGDLTHHNDIGSSSESKRIKGNLNPAQR